jgi:hypothetical protein
MGPEMWWQLCESAVTAPPGMLRAVRDRIPVFRRRMEDSGRETSARRGAPGASPAICHPPQMAGPHLMAAGGGDESLPPAVQEHVPEGEQVVDAGDQAAAAVGEGGGATSDRVAGRGSRAARSTAPSKPLPSPPGSPSRMPPRPFASPAGSGGRPGRRGGGPSPSTRSPASPRPRPPSRSSQDGSAATGRSRPCATSVAKTLPGLRQQWPPGHGHPAQHPHRHLQASRTPEHTAATEWRGPIGHHREF